MPRTGTGRIYQRGVKKDDPPGPNKVWWLDYSFRGKRYRESSESTFRCFSRRTCTAEGVTDSSSCTRAPRLWFVNMADRQPRRARDLFGR